jgi:hypothetical protein
MERLKNPQKRPENPAERLKRIGLEPVKDANELFAGCPSTVTGEECRNK